jgi:hypothetical protein
VVRRRLRRVDMAGRRASRVAMRFAVALMSARLEQESRAVRLMRSSVRVGVVRISGAQGIRLANTTRRW